MAIILGVVLALALGVAVGMAITGNFPGTGKAVTTNNVADHGGQTLTVASPTASATTAPADTSPPATTASASPSASPTTTASSPTPGSCTTPVALDPNWKLGATVASADQLVAVNNLAGQVAYYTGDALGAPGLQDLLTESKCVLPVLVRVDSDLNALSTSAARDYLRTFVNQPWASVVTSVNHAKDGSIAGINARVAFIRSVVGTGTKIYVEIDAHHEASRSSNRETEAGYLRGTDGLLGGFFPHGGSALYGGTELIKPSAADMASVVGTTKLAGAIVQGFPWSADPVTARNFGFTDLTAPAATVVGTDIKAFRDAGVNHVIVELLGPTAAGLGTSTYLGDIFTAAA
ncbi:MAG TPA: hypothetical protein VMT30_03395 [Candidatus Saccharimonadia bacterium]|nr:hypothetical protein [Candidatus Saccharimonadia bacterium]